METIFNGFVISDERERLDIDTVCTLLKTTYWANKRSLELIEKSIANSLCFGVYEGEKQVGFCRCVTDYATFFWLADVIIDEAYRRLGLGKALIKMVSDYPVLKPLRGALATRDANWLYALYDFIPTDERFMTRPPEGTVGIR